jgi:predicted ATP-grasp superfamily ATP-dependent carboligase
LILGLSTRAIAESAVRGGYDVLTLDYFGDRDQKELVENYSLMRDFHLGFGARALLEASRQLDFEAVVYISNLENHPDVVEELSEGHILLGNTPQTLQEVRHWPTLRSFCLEEGIAFPPTIFADEDRPKGRGRWLRKPVRSGGGHGIAFWAGEPLDEGHLLQEHIEGLDCSAAFVADGRNCVLLGVTKQLIGREELGARGFAWCGNILPLSLPSQELGPFLKAVGDMAVKLTRRFGLRGLNGIDFVLTRHQDQLIPCLVEVNPRHTASMELIEWAYGLNVFGAHVRSFDGKLPAFHLEKHLLPHPSSYYGKAIVYARRDGMMPDTAGWRAKGRRDIPFPGERIAVRHPICTVLAQGRTRDECWRRLLLAARMVHQEVGKPLQDNGEQQK